MDRHPEAEPGHREEPQRHEAPEPQAPDARLVLPATIGNAAMSRMVARARTKTKGRGKQGRGKPLEGDKRKRFLWTNILERRLGPGPHIATLVGARDCGRSVDELQALYEGTHDATLAVDLARIEGATAEQLVALANHDLRLSVGHIRRLVAAGRTAAQLSEIRAKGSRSLTRFGLISIAATPGRSLQDAIDLAKAASDDVSGERLAKLSGLGAPDEHRLTPIQAIDLAKTPVSLKVLEDLLGHDLQLTARQVEALARAGRTVEDVTWWTDLQRGLTQRAVAAFGAIRDRSRLEVVRLANGAHAGRSIEDVAALAALRDGALRFSVEEVLKVAAVPVERSVDALIELARHPAKLTADELVAVAKAGRTAKDLTDLMQGPPVVGRGDAVTLAAVKGRSLKDLGELSTGVPSNRPMSELAELASHGGDAPRLESVEDIKQVGDTPERTVGELKDLLDHALALTPSEVAKIGTAKRTGVELTTLSDDRKLPRAQVIALASLPKRTMPDVLKLVDSKPGHRTVEDLVKLAELGDADPSLTADQLLAIAGIETLTQDQLVTLGKGVKTLRPGRTCADLVAVASAGAPDFALTPEAAVRILNATGLPATLTRTDIVAFAASVKGLAGDQIVELLGWLHPSATAPNTVSLLTRLKDSEVDGANLYALVKAFKDLAQTGAQIYTRVDRYMRNFKVEDDTDITEPETAAADAGTRVLTGTMLVKHLTTLLAAPVVGVMGTIDQSVKRYPTGENPAALSEVELWNHCKLDPVVPIVNETAQQKPIRQRLALNQLMTDGRFAFRPLNVQQLFGHDEGQSPRAIKGPAAEDALDPIATAHTNDRHVLGSGGTISTLQDLAMRSLSIPNFFGHSPAGAFEDAGEAQTGIQDALDAFTNAAAPTNWESLRRSFARGDTREWTQAGVNASGSRMDGNPTLINQLPPYSNPGGFGTSPLYNGENFHNAANAAGKFVERNPATRYRAAIWGLVAYNGDWVRPAFRWTDAAGPPLATLTIAPPDVRLRLIGDNVEGGFFVHSAWPE
jgi:hypothetical protein